jgi:hypothetical protein
MLDLAGESSKDYKLNFFAYKTGMYKFIITFKMNQLVIISSTRCKSKLMSLIY